MGLKSTLSFAHQLIEDRVLHGDIVIDATVGNGADTLFLAKLVGPHGVVYGFDIQPQALDKARLRIEKANLGEGDSNVNRGSNIRFFLRSHAEMEQTLPQETQGRVAAIMFNLGYLPGNNRGIITRPESTIPALDASLCLLRQDGVVTVILYSGHEGGKEEADAVLSWAAQLSQESYEVLCYRFLNQKNTPPFLIAVEKK